MSMQRARAIWNLTILAVFVWGSIAVPSAAQVAAQAKEGGVILGRVVDAVHHGGIPGARVTCWRVGAESAQHEVISDKDGQFLFRDIPAGDWRVVAELPGFDTGAYGRRRPGGSAKLLTVTEGGYRTGVEIDLFQTHGILSGTVLDASGQPAVGAVVRAIRQNAIQRDGTSAMTVWPTASRADDQGHYRISLPAGNYVLAVIPRWAIAVSSQQPLHSQARTRARGLGPIQVTPRAGPFAVVGRYRLFLGDVGSLALAPRMSPSGDIVGAYEIAMSSKLTAGGSFLSVVGGQERIAPDIHVQLSRSVSVSGRVLYEGKGLPDIGVRLIPRELALLSNDPGIDAAEAISGTNGAFSLLGIPAGDYVLRAILTADPTSRPSALAEAVPSTFWANFPISVGGSNVDGLTLDLARGATVTGHVVIPGGDPTVGSRIIPRVSIALRALEGQSWRLSAHGADQDGTFATGGYPPGRYLLRVTAPRGWILQSAMYHGNDISLEPFTLDGQGLANVSVTLTNRPAAVAGTVRKPDGNPDDNATVLVFPSRYVSDHGLGAPPERLREQHASKDGSFQVGSLPAGQYRVIAIDDALADGWRTIGHLDQLGTLSTVISLKMGETTRLDLRVQAIQWK